jgi:hypothetical protein
MNLVEINIIPYSLIVCHFPHLVEPFLPVVLIRQDRDVAVDSARDMVLGSEFGNSFVLPVVNSSIALELTQEGKTDRLNELLQ